MILTVTLNPAIDKTLEVPNFAVGQHARARLRALAPAGKGVNVARGVARLGAQATACLLVGAGERAVYEESLRADGIACVACVVRGVTRTNTTILDPVARTTTHLREEGLAVTERDVEGLRSALAAALARRPAGGACACVFSGSLPPGLSAGAFAAMLHDCRRADAEVVVDTGGEALRAAVESGCAGTIKPNLAELEELLGPGCGAPGASRRAQGLLDRVQTVLLTLGADGAWLVQRGVRLGMSCRLAGGEVVNTVGCGDAFLAGWLVGSGRQGDPAEALKWAVAAGAACARTETAVAYTRGDVEELLPRCRPLT
jgi:1-phosphofructokinase family hexose kinase